MTLALPKPMREDRHHTEIDWREFKLPKQPAIRDKKLRRFIVAEHPCSIRGRKDHRCGPKYDDGKHVLIDPAHVPSGGRRKGIGMKVDDTLIIPLCRWAHMQQHAMGWPSFADKYGIDPLAEAKQLAKAYAVREARR